VGREVFWMYLINDIDPHKHKYYSRKEAKIEAERIARLHGKDVFLLEATHYVTFRDPVPPAIWHIVTPSKIEEEK